MQFFKLAAAMVAAASAVSALDVTKPNSEEWWGASSRFCIAACSDRFCQLQSLPTVMDWDCKASDTNDKYTVLIKNENVPTLTIPQAIIAIINNFDCSISITVGQADQPPATGYQLLLADPLNNTHVFGTSQPFEIKPLGSLYYSQVNGGKGSGSASGSGGASPTSGSSTGGDEGSALGLASSTFAVAGAAVAGVFAALF
ncbi:hypothetical protein BKA70DRAFT_1278865 [Coprinopsis sp. MPI-PUGE-AT-0042]|nr:hypothetical protein BKA70DRAFT_1278865 [Coprinopsis sp. MPI-PUGE-AT-0042]